jgi:phosphoglycerate dehydrogenase-like enzyme
MQPLRILIGTSSEFVVGARHLARIREIVPDVELVIKPGREMTEADVRSADIVWGWPRPPHVEGASRLRWIQLASAGADHWTGIRPEVLLTKSSGVFGIPIAEWVIGAMVALSRGFHLYRDQQRERIWKAGGAREVFGATVGLVGLGDIGQNVAVRAKGLGCRVLGARRRSGTAAPPSVDAVLPLDDLLPLADYLVLAVPHTPETNGLISAGRLERMKRGSCLLNVGRGATLDEQALIEALRSGRLSGAALDVTAVEPLPPESPLWEMPNVIITPHSSGRSQEANADRRTDIFCDNLRRFLAGEPLRNAVDRQAGY